MIPISLRDIPTTVGSCTNTPGQSVRKECLIMLFTSILMKLNDDTQLKLQNQLT